VPQFASEGQLARCAQSVASGELAPGLVCRWLRCARAHRLKLLRGDIDLALSIELLGDCIAQIWQQSDVERGILEPRIRQWASRPVGGRVRLAELNAEQLFDDTAEPDTFEAEQARRELGIE